METLDDPFPYLWILTDTIIHLPADYQFYIGLAILLLLLFLSGMISGSETAFFSLSTAQTDEIEHKEDRKSKRIVQLLSKPKHLLGTILIANNFVNVAIVMLSAYLSAMCFTFPYPWLGFLVEVVLVTFILLLLGEITPKVLAKEHNVKFSYAVCNLIYATHQVISPMSKVLALSTQMVDKRIQKRGYELSKSELDNAIELTTADAGKDEEKNMLKGIVKFSDMETSEIMCARVDITSIDYEASFDDIMQTVVQSGFSRIPVFHESPDVVKGILYIKDLLPHLQQPQDFAWNTLIRPAFFAPETQKVNDLLQAFREKKIHLAIVVDEYGGTSGLVTLEDVLEEIVGEINDEFDDVESDVDYKKIDDNTYLFDAKTSLHDFCKLLDIEDDTFDEVEGDFDTLAGLLLELHGNIAGKGTTVEHNGFSFEVESLDYRRIKKIMIKRLNKA